MILLGTPYIYPDTSSTIFTTFAKASTYAMASCKRTDHLIKLPCAIHSVVPRAVSLTCFDLIHLFLVLSTLSSQYLAEVFRPTASNVCYTLHDPFHSQANMIHVSCWSPFFDHWISSKIQPCIATDVTSHFHATASYQM